MGRHKLLTEKQIEWARQKLFEGYTQKEVAAALYVPQATLSRTLDGNIPQRPPLVYDFSKEVECEK